MRKLRAVLVAAVLGAATLSAAPVAFAAPVASAVPQPGDCPGCGGFAGLPCPEGFVCVDDPRDSCDPKKGGADCGGICVPEGLFDDGPAVARKDALITVS
ncbi:hypothetical protein ABT160_20435 [Streptomyces sp. NPDC001941]|uniref:hypothetical protein n=1 Tax=Streptomyces sp. NPDC001941 TaxID=3154659 RepID=UPI003321A87A